MNKNLQSPTKLTEFAPLQPEERQQSVGQFISRFFKLGRSSPGEEQSPAVSETSSDVSQELVPSWAVDANVEASEKTRKQQESYYEVDVTEGRSLPNVLKRISNLLVLKSTNLQAYSDTELKQYWMPDSVSKECYECGEKFTTFRRRHHCRVCGQIFCSQCCNQQIPGKIFGCTGDLRVCTYCCKVVLSYLQSPDVGVVLTADLLALQENLQSKYGVTSPGLSLCGSQTTLDHLSPQEPHENIRRKISVGYQEEKFAIGRSVSTSYLSPEEKCKVLQNSLSLRSLYEEMSRPTTGIPLRSHRHRLRTYADCFLGSELVDWLIYQQKANTRVQAAAIGQALLEGGYIECLSEPSSFVDGYAVYKMGFISADPPQQPTLFEVPGHDEPVWVQQISQESSTTDSEAEQPNPPKGRIKSSSSYMLDLNIEANTVYLSKPPLSVQSPNSPDGDLKNETICDESHIVKTSEQRELVPKSGWYNAPCLREENGEKMAYDMLSSAFKSHKENMLNQLLSAQGLPESWGDHIISLVDEVVDTIRPDRNHDAQDIDIRQYVQFKKVPSGSQRDCKLVHGIVCTKNIAHKNMAVSLENPKILLLQCSLVYQRTEGRLMSLEPILMQEHEYLRNVVARIVALQPDVVMVQKNVSRLAQDLLRDQGLTLILNVKQSILERLAISTQADLVTSMDVHIGRPRLGTCKHFYLKRFGIDGGGSKTLMFFEGLPLPHLGGTILLRGASKPELKQIKKIASLFLFACYNWRLEKSFLMDEFAQPPDLQDEFFDDSKENSPVTPVCNKPSVDEPKSGANTFFVETDADNEVFSKGDCKSLPVKDARNKAEEKVGVSGKEFSDPLLSCGSEGEVFRGPGNEKLAVAELPFLNGFRKAFDDTVLSISPYLVCSLPYLETEAGRKCKLRHFFPNEIYFHSQLTSKKRNKSNKDTKPIETEEHQVDTKLRPLHQFISTRIRTSIEDNELQGMLAHFRACGSRSENRRQIPNGVAKQSCVEMLENCVAHLDALEPINHQRLSVLFCSYSLVSNNAPEFCVKMVVDMEFYGVNDIPLGCFLERYCFRPSYTCASSACDAPMLKHIRRFVHNGGCLSLSLNSFETEFTEDNIVMWSWCCKCQSVSPVVEISRDTWSLSFAKYLELRFYGGIYSRRGISGCLHSLHHDHYQYFGYKNFVASFKYTPVPLWEISLPPALVTISYNFTAIQNELVDEIKGLALKVHEVYSTFMERLAELTLDPDCMTSFKQGIVKEQIGFKQKIEGIQINLTSPILERREMDFNDPNKDILKALWRIEDSVVNSKRCFVESIEQWNTKLIDAMKKKDTEKKKDKDKTVSAESEGSAVTEANLCTDKTESSDTVTNDQSNSLATKKISEVSEDVKIHSSDTSSTTQPEETQDNKKETDKKTVKTILSQLLPSAASVSPVQSPFKSQEHYTLPIGVLAPMVVYETEPSSIIAYALNSQDYRHSLEEVIGKKSQSLEQSPSPVHRRRGNSDKERSEGNDFVSSGEKSTGILSFLRNRDSKSDLLGSTSPTVNTDPSVVDEQAVPIEKFDDTKKGKTVHIEVQFLDQSSNCNFFCRVYYAERFARLRSLVLPDGEEAYIRSLSRCIQWNARGGKSGSTFCKTKDDRFVLKEMPKSEVQLFLEWAHNYFLYIQKCYASGQPTLLAKIVGIYQIIYRNGSSNAALRTNFLVMENLFYNRTVSHKFDLKGSMRNRLVNPENQDGEIVLLDENLLKMTCDDPLYILPHSKAVLKAAIHNDTEFLAAQSVMDYSLLVGLDTNNKDLVLGIIDYIRTFTWDKKIETMVKKSGLLGGQGKLPTIISPEEYRKRFIEAMHKYFLIVPDHWSGLGSGLD